MGRQGIGREEHNDVINDGGRLLEFCLKAACHNKQSVMSWRKKRRTLEMLPSELAERLFHRLLQSHLLSAPLIELFQQTLQEADLSGEANVDGEWMAYVGGCRHLRVLRATDCKALSNNAIWHLTGLRAMEELDFARCKRISDEAVSHIVSLKGLKKLGLAETSVGTKGLSLLPEFTSLTSLDLGGCPMTDGHLISFQVLKKLEHLDLWGSKVTNVGAQSLSAFKSLKSLNLALTEVTVIPQLDSITSLNLCNCAVNSIFEEEIIPGNPLKELFLSGSVISLRDVTSGLNIQNVHLLDLASTHVQDLDAFIYMQELSILDLSATGLTDALMPKFIEFGKNLRWLDLSSTKIGSEGVGSITGCVPKLEQLSLSQSLVDDHVFAYLAHFPALRSINLSGSKVEGCMLMGPEELVRTSVVSYLEQLLHLRRLDLQHTGVNDATFTALTTLTRLTHLALHSTYLSDECLQQASSLPNLVYMGIGGSVVTDGGLRRFNAPPLLQELDLSDCWLLSEGAVLKFCEAHPHIMVWNKWTLEVTKRPKVPVNRKEFGDVVGGGKATSSTRELQAAKLNLWKSPLKSVGKGTKRPMKKPSYISNRGNGGDKSLPILVGSASDFSKQNMWS